MATIPYQGEEKEQVVSVRSGTGFLRFVIALGLMVGVLAALPPKAAGWLAVILILGAFLVNADMLKEVLG